MPTPTTTIEPFAPPIISYWDFFQYISTFITESPIFSRNGALDAKSCNHYIYQNGIIVESIETYLSGKMQVKETRSPGSLVTMLIPKEGYVNQTFYTFSDFWAALPNFDIKYYSFVGGVNDEHFVEVLIIPEAISSYVYIAYASDDEGSDFTMTFEPELDYIAIIATDTEIVSPEASDFAGLWKAYKGADGYTPIKNVDYFDGEDGVSTYIYIAYASDNIGTGFSLMPNDLLKYRAEIHVSSPLDPPTSTDFSAATWIKYIGDDGEDGGGEGGSEPPELHLDFEEAGDEFVYNVPYDMKLTSQDSENGDATLDIALDTDMPRFTKLTITATTVGLVSLYGEFI